MNDTSSRYPIQSADEIQHFLESYLPRVLSVAQQFGLDLSDPKFEGDHLGLQVMSGEEFDSCHNKLLAIASLVHDGMIHNRRNRIYRFNRLLKTNNLTVPKIEIFEPKPNTDLSKLRPSIEHIAFVVKNYDAFLNNCRVNNVPIDKEDELNGSKFFKTKLLNGTEIEFRSDRLGENNQ